ncbi:MAG: bifunctional phosphoribosylaminoimidazolecarboxamide formyltransferase/IMP cyclohydrolase [Bacteroidota bacterium]|nr:bifunctional phosphoribosylaminoimidazolecarboxamide formyltransferase/IMP cyclohydrolase [Bacteroidota bacterium]
MDLKQPKQIKSALISVFDKNGLMPILEELKRLDIKIISTGGTYNYIKKQGFDVEKVENITDYPSIFGGRVKTLHPKVFGGILYRRDNDDDKNEAKKYQIDSVDLVVVDLYPFSETVKEGKSAEEIIEKIDIGGISLIRAAAKNFKDVVVIPSKNQYAFLLNILSKQNGKTKIIERKIMASQAFSISSSYDSDIFNYIANSDKDKLKINFGASNQLRYGENPHQTAFFYGDLEKAFTQYHGKQISYNNLLDIDSSLKLIKDFDKNTFAIFKHLNPCGLASRKNPVDAWKDALAGDPVSAFGGIIVTKGTIHSKVADEINKLFFEVILASGYSANALEILKKKKNRIILQINDYNFPLEDIKTALFGTLVQDCDTNITKKSKLNKVTTTKPTEQQISDLLFANRIVKHVKSNAIVLVKNNQLIGAGMGQPNRIDALKQAINKAQNFGFDTKGAVMASDAFFPFYDTVQTAHESGINAVIQPGGSIRDKESIDYCNKNNVAMVFTGVRHFKH